MKSLRREIEGARPILKVPPEVWIDRIKRLDALRDLVAKHIDQARESKTREYNKNKRDVQFSERDLVTRRTHPLSNGINKFSAKLVPKYEGPLKIIIIIIIYLFRTVPKKKLQELHCYCVYTYYYWYAQTLEKTRRYMNITE